MLALPGPTEVEPALLMATLEGALAAEEIRLEEAAVIRAMRAGRGAQSGLLEPESEPGPARP